VSLANRKSLEPWLSDSIQYYEHQVTGIRQLARMQNFLLADDMGLGKSLQALTVAAIDVKRGWADKIIIVAPVSLKLNWADEIEKFTTFPYVTFGTVEHPTKPGHFKKLGPADREEQLYEFDQVKGPKILICNYEQIHPHLDMLNKMGFHIAIFDESQFIKNYKAKRTKACLRLKTNRSFLLTGTPLLNQVNELWPQLHKIDPAGYPKYWSFINRYCKFGGWKNKQIIGVKNEKELTERLKKVMVRRLKEDVLDLPEIQFIQRRVDLHPEQRDLYDEAEETLQIELQGVESPLEMENALVKFLRLKQICGTTWQFNGRDISSKLDLAILDSLELLYGGHKIVVFTQFRDVQEMYCRRLDAAAGDDFDIWELNGDVKDYQRVPTVQEWGQSERPSALVCMLQISGYGLNMTAARHALFLDKLFVPGLNRQATDRLHRIGASTTQNVQILEYICKNTVENRVEAILRQKKKLFESIVEESDFKRKLVAALLAREDDDE
jgi:SNF2 family DNA or RNA helicase